MIDERIVGEVCDVERIDRAVAYDVVRAIPEASIDTVVDRVRELAGTGAIAGHMVSTGSGSAMLVRRKAL